MQINRRRFSQNIYPAEHDQKASKISGSNGAGYSWKISINLIFRTSLDSLSN